MDEGRFSGFLQTLYAASAEPSAWPLLAPQLATLFDCGSGVVRLVHRDSLAFNLASVTPNLMARANLYEQYYQYRDPWAAFIRTNRNRTVIDEQMLPERDWIRSEVYNEHASKLGIYRFLGTGIDIDDETIGVIAVHRSSRQPNFGERERGAFERCVPHFRQAMKLRRELGAVRLARDASMAALECLETAALVVAHTGRIAFANSLAVALLENLEGLSAKHGRLTATSSAGEPLAEAIRTMAVGPVLSNPMPHNAAILRRKDGVTLSALVCPLASHAGATLVILRDPNRRQPAPQSLLMAMFGLTRSEAEIASALSRGESPEIIADRRRASVHTVRNQTKAVLAKTGTSRQAELVALLSRTIGPLTEV